METNRIRTNPLSLPASLVRRDLPWLTAGELAARAATFDMLEDAARKPAPGKPKIVSSAHGPIKHLLLAYPQYRKEHNEYTYQETFQDLFTQMPPYTRFTILAHPTVVDDLETVIDQTGVRPRATILESPEHMNFSVWAEDPYVVVHDVERDPATVFLLEPYSFPRYGDALIADLAAEGTSIQGMQSVLYFQGGNVLIGDDFVLIGADYPARTLEMILAGQGHILIPPHIRTPAQLREHVRELYRSAFDSDRMLHLVGVDKVPVQTARVIEVDGKPWLEEMYLGNHIGTAQPMFHIDMFITLAGRSPDGRYRLLVGSPEMADNLLGRPPQDQGMPRAYDAVAQLLETLGFEVVRNPLPVTYVDEEGPLRLPNGVEVAGRRTWYFATSNNCLVQIDDVAGNHVWLPTYGHGDWSDLRVTDQGNKETWEALGFEVHQLGNFHFFAQNLGAVHCIKKYLER